ncbi:MAG: manganese efflux pump MntP family protein [Patescibacteria group bacterium]|jgi:putative Mn2+ efflux pump MntP
MSLINIFFIAIALSFDAMAVAAANGAHHHQMGAKKALRIAFFFGFFQFLMPLIGYILGIGLVQFISGIDHWIAFILLTILGVRMLIESFKKEEEKKIDIHSLKILLTQSIATSIDALIIGVTIALLPVNIWLSVSIIGITTFTLSLISIYIGKKSGEKWGKKAEIIGGLVLIGIGLKILLGHLL